MGGSVARRALLRLAERQSLDQRVARLETRPEAVLEYIAGLDDRLAALAGAADGPARDAVQHLVAAGGKRVRPLLCLLPPGPFRGPGPTGPWQSCSPRRVSSSTVLRCCTTTSSTWARRDAVASSPDRVAPTPPPSWGVTFCWCRPWSWPSRPASPGVVSAARDRGPDGEAEFAPARAPRLPRRGVRTTTSRSCGKTRPCSNGRRGRARAAGRQRSAGDACGATAPSSAWRFSCGRRAGPAAGTGGGGQVGAPGRRVRDPHFP